MNYYFVIEKNGNRHIVVALNEENARAIIDNGMLELDHFYELNAKTFKDEGFLISEK